MFSRHSSSNKRQTFTDGVGFNLLLFSQAHSKLATCQTCKTLIKTGEVLHGLGVGGVMGSFCSVNCLNKGKLTTASFVGKEPGDTTFPATLCRFHFFALLICHRLTQLYMCPDSQISFNFHSLWSHCWVWAEATGSVKQAKWYSVRFKWILCLDVYCFGVCFPCLSSLLLTGLSVLVIISQTRLKWFRAAMLITIIDHFKWYFVSILTLNKKYTSFSIS